MLQAILQAPQVNRPTSFSSGAVSASKSAAAPEVRPTCSADFQSVVFGKKAAWRANQELRECFGVPALVEQNCNPVVTQL